MRGGISFYKIPRKKKMTEFKDIWVKLFLFSFFFMILISFVNIEQSYSPLKYYGYLELDKLLDHYNEYKTDFKSFLYNTYIFPTGNSSSSNKSFYFLFPLFIGIDLLGELNLANLYRIVVIFGLASIILLFLFLKKYWGSPIAFFSSVFYGFSPWFQELFRSHSYHGPSVFIALLILYIAFEILEREGKYQGILSFLLGLFIGIGYYYYGMLRGLILFGLIILWQKKNKRLKSLSLFFTGILLIVGLGIYLRFSSGGVFFDKEFFLSEPKPWGLLFKQPFLIFYQIFTPKVIQAGDYNVVSHARLLLPILFLPFTLGVFISTMQKQKHNKLFNLFSLILFFSILITTNCQIRRMTLLIIPTYIYTGIGTFYIYTLIQKIKINRLAPLLKIIFTFIIILIILLQVLYINSKILNSERTLGFLRVAQEIKKQNISGKIFLLMKDSRKKVHGEREEVFIKLENYEKFSMKTIDIQTIDPEKLEKILLSEYPLEFYLIITPFFESIIIERYLTGVGLRISELSKIGVPQGLKNLCDRGRCEIKNSYFSLVKAEWKK
jgi:hypothetical protein